MAARSVAKGFLLSVALSQILVIAEYCSFEDVAVQRPQAPTQRQEIYLGLLLPVHEYDHIYTCGNISESQIVHMETFFWALNSYYDRYNTSSPRARLRGVAIDSCDSPDIFYERFHNWEDCKASPDFAKPKILAYLTHDHSHVLSRAARHLSRTGEPLIGVSPYNPKTDPELYPTFYKMTPSAEQQVNAMVELLVSQNWRNVTVVHVIDDYGFSALREFSAKAKANDIHIFLERHLNHRADDDTIRYTLQSIRDSASAQHKTLVVVFAYGRHLEVVRSFLNDRFVILSFNDFYDIDDGAEFGKSVNLALRYAPPGVDGVDTLTSHLQELTLNRTDVISPWFEPYFRQKLNCNTTCRPDQRLGSAAPSINRRSFAVMVRSVDAVVGAFLEAHKDGCSDLECFGAIKADFGPALERHLGEAGVNTDTNVLQNWEYKLFSTAENGSRLISTEVGTVQQEGDRVVVSVPESVGVRLSQEATGATRYDLGHDWVIAIGVLAALGILLVIATAVLIVVLKKKATAISYALLYGILLLGAFLGYLTLFAFIPVPTLATCTLIRLGIGLSYAICLSVMVVIALKMFTKQESSLVLRRFIYVVLALLIAAEVVILVMWLLLVRPGAPVVLGNSGEPVRVCSHFTPPDHAGLLPVWAQFIRTDFENHLLALVYVMALIVLLLVLGLLVFIRRRVMMDPVYNIEAALILAAGVGTALLWLAWALVGGLTKDHAYAQEFGDGALAFGLWLILTLLVVLLLVQLLFYWKSSNGKLLRRKPKVRKLAVENVLENRHVTDGDVHEQIVLETTKETTTLDQPIKVVENERVIPIEVIRVEDSRNNTSRTNGKVITTKETKSEVHTHGRESQTLPRDHERYAVHVGQAKLSGTGDSLRANQHHNVVRHHSSGDHGPGHTTHTVEHHYTTGHTGGHTGGHTAGHTIGHTTSGNHHPAGHNLNGNVSCSECGLAINPYALHLKHPKSEKILVHNTSTHVTEGGGHVVTGDTSFAHSDLAAHTTFEPHPIYTKSPYGHINTPIYYSNRRPEAMHTNQRVMRISREASGRVPSRHGMSFSEYDRANQYSRSFRRTRSEEQLGSL